MNKNVSQVRRQRAVNAYVPLAKQEADPHEATAFANNAADTFSDQQFMEYLQSLVIRHKTQEGKWAFEAFRRAVRNWENSIYRR